MSRNLLPLMLAAAVLAGCGGGKSETQAPPAEATPVAAVAAPTPAPAVTSAPPVEKAPIVANAATPAAAPTPAPAPPANVQSTPPKTAPPQQADALQWMKDAEARRVDYQRRLDEAKFKLDNADLAMAAWERNVLAFKNPFLARPQLSPEDTQAIAGMDGGARVRWAEGRLSQISAQRDAAKKALDDLKANPPIN